MLALASRMKEKLVLLRRGSDSVVTVMDVVTGLNLGRTRRVYLGYSSGVLRS